MRWKILIMALVLGMFVHIVLLHSVSATTSARVIELTRTSSTDIFSSWSPDGKKLALFGRFNLSDPFGIWIIDIDGGKRMQLATFEPPSSLKPAWSPDGRKIGYTSGGNISVIILDEDIAASEAGKTTGFDAVIAILALVVIYSLVRMRR